MYQNVRSTDECLNLLYTKDHFHRFSDREVCDRPASKKA